MSAPVALDEQALISALRDGDESAFTSLVEAEGPMLLRLALMHVPSRAVAEEVVQDTWLAVLNGIDRFEGRSSLRTWIDLHPAEQGAYAGPARAPGAAVLALRRRHEEGRDEPAVAGRPLPGPPRVRARGVGSPAGGMGLARGAPAH